MSESDWVIVLRVLYQEAPEPVSNRLDDDNPVLEQTTLSRQQVSDSFDALSEWELIKRKPVTIGYNPDSGGLTTTEWGYVLTKSGFRRANEREVARRDNRTNQAVVFFTFVLVMVEILNIFDDNWMKYALIILLLILMLVYIRKSDVFGGL